MEKDLHIYPRYFGPKLKQHLQDELVRKVEGTCSGRFGFIITVTQVLGFDSPEEFVSKVHGKIKEGMGFVTFTLKYQAIVFRPFKGEVLDALVTLVNKMGFFAEVGPLQVFVSKHAMPADFAFDPQSNPISYVSQASDEQPMRIAKESTVRLRIIGTHFDATEIRAIGTIKEHYLGVI